MTEAPSLEDSLLEVAFGTADNARRAWSRIAPSLRIDDLPFELHGLFPSVAIALRRLGLQPPEIRRFDGVRRRLWALNVVRARALIDAVGVLSGHDITAVVSGGMAVLLHRDDLGLRPLTEVDLLIEPRAGERALSRLQTAGWDIVSSRRDGFWMDYRATVIVKAGQTVTLRWVCDTSVADRHYWAPQTEPSLSRSTLDLGPDQLMLASPTDVLAFTLIDGPTIPGYFPVRRRLDTVLLASMPGSPIGWSRFTDEVDARNAQPEVAAELFGVAGLDVTIPAAVMAQLASASIPGYEPLLRAVTGRSPTVTACLRRRRTDGLVRGLSALPRALADVWGLPWVGSLPMAFAKRLGRRANRYATGRRRS